MRSVDRGTSFFPLSARGMVRNVIRSEINANHFLRNFEPAVRTPEKRRRAERVTERLLIDIFDPDSQVSYVLLGGLPGSGKTTYADALAQIITDASLEMIAVERRSFSHYRARAIQEMQQRGEVWTKVRETEIATKLMKQEALGIIKRGPRLPDGQRRIVIAEMPIYPVDEKERGISLVGAIGRAERYVPYSHRRARVNFVTPDLDVIKNAMVTRLLRMSSGGSADMLYEIAFKAYGGAVLFRQLQPKLYDTLERLIKNPRSCALTRHDVIARRASKVISLRMLSILLEAGLYGPLDTLLMNPSRKSLLRRSRRFSQIPIND